MQHLNGIVVATWGPSRLIQEPLKALRASDRVAGLVNPKDIPQCTSEARVFRPEVRRFHFLLDSPKPNQVSDASLQARNLVWSQTLAPCNQPVG